jgi:hypothetical protein
MQFNTYGEPRSQVCILQIGSHQITSHFTDHKQDAGSPHHCCRQQKLPTIIHLSLLSSAEEVWYIDNTHITINSERNLKMNAFEDLLKVFSLHLHTYKQTNKQVHK